MADNKSCEGKYVVYECINCRRLEVLPNPTDGKSCPKCDGYLNAIAMTDNPNEPLAGIYIRNSEYKHGIDWSSRDDYTVETTLDINGTIKGLKAIQREARKATAAFKELEEQRKDKHLVIELDDLGDVPKVFYKGKEITTKEFINFQWQTRTDTNGHTDIIVDYFERSTKDNALVEKKSIREGVES